MKTYNKANIPLAKKLRKNMTPWERKLWYEFLNKYPLRFQRQKSIGDYIVDFYCAKAKLIIELDGGGHFNAQAEKIDYIRTNELQSLGFTVIHIANNDIDRNFAGVCQFIDEAVKALIPT
ncbi:MAG: endonuclease domain-containing protein [Clostridia bacterium]|nr:endonuclease domain-containing protein [Clostridia bacterium]